jgi:predicted DsbA family dithiol-disulfide isomerase
MAVIDVEITADMICPFCYLGKKNLDKAIEKYTKEHPEDEFEVVWKPFYLYPGAMKSGTLPCLPICGSRAMLDRWPCHRRTTD